MQVSREDCRFGVGAALVAGAGAVLSGPVALGVVALVAPQPPWRDGELFARSYHPIQVLPYALGFLLIAGCVGCVVALSRDREPRLARRRPLALALAAVFAAFILLNYVIQTTFVPGLVAHFRPDLAVIIEALTMVNPAGLGWALEMWGYAFLGVALWLLAPSLSETRVERVAAALVVTNGVMSVAGGVATAVQIDWVFSPAGLASYAAWNLVIVVLCACLALAWRERLSRLRAGA